LPSQRFPLFLFIIREIREIRGQIHFGCGFAALRLCAFASLRSISPVWRRPKTKITLYQVVNNLAIPGFERKGAKARRRKEMNVKSSMLPLKK